MGPVLPGRLMRRTALVTVAAWLGLTVPLSASAARLPDPAAGPSRQGAAEGLPPVAPEAAVPIVAADSANVLDRPMIDVAGVRPGAGQPERLLVVLPPGVAGDAPRIELIVDEPGGWTVADGRDLWPLDLARAAGRLIALPGDETFMLILGAPDDDRARIAIIGVDGTRLRSETARTIGSGVVGAGAADVDGDGTADLVIATRDPATSASGEACSRLEIRDIGTMALVETRPIGLVESVALADVDPRPGSEILVLGTGCDAAAGRRLEVHAAGVPQPIAVVGLETGRDEALVAPLVTPVPGDGGPVVIVTSGERTVVVDPADRWRARDLVEGPARPMGSAAGPDATSVVLASLAAGRVTGMERVDLGRDSDGRLAIPSPVPIERTTANLDRWMSVRPHPDAGDRWPVGARFDVDGDGCGELIVPLLVIACAGSTSAEERVGPAWIATRPVAVVEGRERRLLVAASMTWAPGGRGLAEPRPWASVGGVAGGWRAAPSEPFVLAELTAADLLYFRTFPIPGPSVDPVTGAEPLQATVAARAGDRAFVRLREVDPLDLEGPVVAVGDRPTSDFLRAPAGPEETVVLARSPVDAGRRSGVELRAVRVPLEATLDDIGPGRAWRVETVTLSDWGEVSRPVGGFVALDTSGPTLTVRPPFLSAPWPFTTRIVGTSDPGSRVGLAGGPAVEAARRGGRFELDVTLAPWPQRLEILAVDRDGNVSARSLEVVGGLDYRQVPLPAWIGLVASLLVAATVLRRAEAGTEGPVGPGPRGDPSRGAPAEPPLPTIEELSNDRT